MSPMAKRLRCAIAACWMASASIAFAQQPAGLVELAAPSSLECLTSTQPGSLPAYPEAERAMKRYAVVRVRLMFDRPDAPPAVKEFYNSGTAVFSEVVAEHLRHYRLPCFVAGSPPIVATQEFRFDPTDGRKVVSAEPRTEGTRPNRLACAVSGESKPTFAMARRAAHYKGTRMQDGNVVVELTFTDAALAPRVQIVYDGGNADLTRTVRSAVSDYRVPCMKPGDEPVVGRQTFKFRVEDETDIALKNLTLVNLLAAVESIEKEKVRFDFATMGCPFDVRFEPLRPHAPNVVHELALADPNRREFLHWLEGLTLKVPRDLARHVIGLTSTVAVPCGVLDLS